MKQLLETVEGLGKRGIGFRSLTEQFDTTTPGGKLTFHIFGALAEFERSLIRSRVRAGLDAARAKGRIGGRPRSLDEKQLTAVRTLLADSELSVAEIAHQHHVNPATIYRAFPGG